MLLVFDADGLIKLQRAGVLDAVARSHDCVVPELVYAEAVLQGRAALYADADGISEVVGKAMSVETAEATEKEHPTFRGLGRGELAALALYKQIEADAIVSDDLAFLRRLKDEGVPFLVPAAIIVQMVLVNELTGDEAKAALARLRPSIRQDVYLQAMRDLEEEAPQQ